MFAAAAAVYWAAVVLNAEPLLACVTAGLVVANRRCNRAHSACELELSVGRQPLFP